MNVLGGELEPCSVDPVTGYFRDGYCHTAGTDVGFHVVCAVMTEAFLEFSVSAGNDLVTPQPQWMFPGLRPAIAGASSPRAGRKRSRRASRRRSSSRRRMRRRSSSSRWPTSRRTPQARRLRAACASSARCRGSGASTAPRDRSVGELGIDLRDVVAGGRDEGRLVHPVLDPLGPAAERLAELGEVLLDVVEGAEVDERESAGRSVSISRIVCSHASRSNSGGGHGGSRTRRRRPARPLRRPRRASRCRRDTRRGARRGRVSGSTRARRPVADDVDVLGGNRHELAPELVERIAVEPACARFELRRIDDVRGSDLRDVDLERGMLADERARRARMVEVDVREEKMPDVGEREARARAARP